MRAREKGFTLVETLVTGVIAAIMGIALYSLFTVFSLEAKNNEANRRKQAQYAILVDQIGATARKAAAVMQVAESWPVVPGSLATASGVYMRDENGAIIGGYRINGDFTVSEFVDISGWNWKAMSVGPDTIRVKELSPFLLSGDRRQITLALSVIASYKGIKDTVQSRGEVFQCRNLSL